MPEQSFHLNALVRALGDEAFLAHDLFFPDVSCLADHPEDAVEMLHDALVQLLPHREPGSFWTARGPLAIEVGTFSLELAPPSRRPAWQTPLTLSLAVVRWRHGDSFLAHLPTLGIHVLAATEDDREAALPRQIEMALGREKLRTLRALTYLARERTTQLVQRPFTVHVPTPKQQAQAEERDRQKEKSTLEQVANDLTRVSLPPAHEVDDLVERVAEGLTGRVPRGVLLVGPSGVGKSAIAREVVRRRDTLGLAGRAFFGTSGARLVAGMTGFGMWQERCQKVVREAGRRRAILVLGNLQELLEVGRSEHQNQGLGTFLRPWFQRGEVLAICECTPEQLPLIERQDPQLLRAFTQVRVEEPPPDRLERILRAHAKAQGNVVLEDDALRELIRLHRRYATYSASPGRPLRFLTGLLLDRPGHVVDAGHVTAAFSRETGLPPVLLDDAEPLAPVAVREWFAARVIGQAEAVDLVVDVLATIKASLNRPRRPIASLMFIGPTGVGKTEMARSLAEYLFGGVDRLTRFDMSEYADPLAVQRLIGGLGLPEGLLTSRVREQPFSVVLLDEVEKADPQFFDLLLQVLGEGRLTDAHGRLADFCNSVIILTSNLGAESYQQGRMGLVSGSERQHAKEHFVEAVQRAVRPELFNRLDRIVPFAPLDEVTIRGVAARQVELLRRRDGVRYRGVSLEVDDALVGWLARRGFDARYGARPLKRAMERELLAPLATMMNEYDGEVPLAVQLTLDGDAPVIRVRAVSGTRSVWARPEVATVRDVQELRRNLQSLDRCGAAVTLANDIYRRQVQTRRQHFDADLGAMMKLRDDLKEQLEAALAREDEAMLALYTQQPVRPDLAEWLGTAQEGLADLLLRTYLRQFDRSDRVSLAVFSEEPAAMFDLAEAYADVASRGHVTFWQFTPPPGGAKEPVLWEVTAGHDLFAEGRPIEVRRRAMLGPGMTEDDRVALEAQFGDDATRVVPTRSGVIGIGLEVRGQAAFARYTAEAGLHVLQTPKQTHKVAVFTDMGPMTAVKLPEDIGRKGAIGGQKRRRVYRLERQSCDDALMGEYTVEGGDLAALLGHGVEEWLRRRAREVLRS